MSGFEVSGIVLGSLPLISAVEHYVDLVQTVRSTMKYKKGLRNLKNDLDRLGRSYDVFSHSINEMSSVVREFISRLYLNDQDKVQWTESTALRLTIKRAGFRLKRRDFNDLVERLRKHNRYLEKFTNRSIELEPSRRVRKQSSKLQHLAKYAKSIFDTLEASLGCDCRGSDSHTALLGLGPQSSYSAMQLNKRREKFQFQIVVSGVVPEAGPPIGKPIVWQEMFLESAEDDVESNTPDQSLKCPAPVLERFQQSFDRTSKLLHKNVRFLGASRAQTSAP